MSAKERNSQTDQQRNIRTDHEIINELIEKEKDRAIWKAYSERGGIHDILEEFCQAVTNPAVNASSFIDEKSTYMICLTLYHTLTYRISKALKNLDQTLRQIEHDNIGYIPVTRTIDVVKDQAPDSGVKCDSTSNVGFFKKIDLWLMRYDFYRKIRRLFVCEESHSKPILNEAVEIYTEDELAKAAYQMKYSVLLERITMISTEMEEHMKPINRQNDKLLSDYFIQANLITDMINSKIFENPKWKL